MSTGTACRSSAGISKRGYSTKAVALQAGTKARRRGATMRAYKCPECRQWHLTSQPKRSGTQTA